MPSFIQKMSPREQLILIVMAVAALIAGVVFLLVKPQLDAKAKFVKEQQAVEAKIQTAEQALASAKSLRASATDIRMRLSRLREAVPEKSQVPTLLVDLPQLVDSSGVQLAEFSPLAAVSDTGFTQQPVKMAVKGEFFDVLDFIYRVQNFPRYLKVTKIAIKPGEEESSGSEADADAAEAAPAGPAILKADIDAITYYTAPPPTAASDQ